MFSLAWEYGLGPLADPFRQLDDDSLRAADVAEPVAVLIAHQLADELGATSWREATTASMSSTANVRMADARCVRLRVPVVALARRRVELDQLESSVAVRSSHERKFRADALESHDSVHPLALDPSLAVKLESELNKLNRGREVVNHDADVVHPLDRQVPDGTEPRFEHDGVSCCGRVLEAWDPDRSLVLRVRPDPADQAGRGRTRLGHSRPWRWLATFTRTHFRPSVASLGTGDGTPG